MGKQNEKVEAPAKTEKKRKVLTPEERIAKAEADLAALVKKEQARKDKARTAAWEKRDALLKQISERLAKVQEIEDEFGKPDTETSEATDETKIHAV